MAVSRSGSGGTVVPVDVVNSFNSGLKVFILLMKKLCSGSLDVKQLIDQLYEHFSAAEKKLNESIKTIADSCAYEEKNLSLGQREVEDLDKSLNGLLVSLQRTKERLESQKKRVEDAKVEVRDSVLKVEQAGEKLEAAKKSQNDCKTAALITAFIPLVNIVTVPTLLVISYTVLEAAITDARCALDSARSTLEKGENELKKVTKSKEEQEQEIGRLTRQKSTLYCKIYEGKEKIKRLRQELTVKNDLLFQLRQCMLTLSKVSGRSEVLRDQTSFIYDPSQLVIPIQSLMAGLAEIQQCHLSTRAVTESPYWGQLRAIRNVDDDLDGW